MGRIVLVLSAGLGGTSWPLHNQTTLLVHRYKPVTRQTSRSRAGSRMWAKALGGKSEGFGGAAVGDFEVGLGVVWVFSPHLSRAALLYSRNLFMWSMQMMLTRCCGGAVLQESQ